MKAALRSGVDAIYDVQKWMRMDKAAVAGRLSSAGGVVSPLRFGKSMEEREASIRKIMRSGQAAPSDPPISRTSEDDAGSAGSQPGVGEGGSSSADNATDKRAFGVASLSLGAPAPSYHDPVPALLGNIIVGGDAAPQAVVFKPVPVEKRLLKSVSVAAITSFIESVDNYRRAERLVSPTCDPLSTFIDNKLMPSMPDLVEEYVPGRRTEFGEVNATLKELESMPERLPNGTLRIVVVQRLEQVWEDIVMEMLVAKRNTAVATSIDPSKAKAIFTAAVQWRADMPHFSDSVDNMLIAFNSVFVDHPELGEHYKDTTEAEKRAIELLVQILQSYAPVLARAFNDIVKEKRPKRLSAFWRWLREQEQLYRGTKMQAASGAKVFARSSVSSNGAVSRSPPPPAPAPSAKTSTPTIAKQNDGKAVSMPVVSANGGAGRPAVDGGKKCWGCNRPGHALADCRALSPEEKAKVVQKRREGWQQPRVARIKDTDGIEPDAAVFAPVAPAPLRSPAMYTIIDGTKYSLEWDSGATVACGPAQVCSRLIALGVAAATPLPTPMHINTAVGSHGGVLLSRFYITVDLPLHWTTGEEAVIHVKKLYAVEGMGDEILLGVPVLKQLNVNVAELAKLAVLGGVDFPRDSPPPSAFVDAVDSHPAVQSMKRVQATLDEEDVELPPPIGTTSTDDRPNVTAALQKAAESVELDDDITSEVVADLHNVCTEYVEMYRTQLTDAPPIKFPPLKLDVLPSIVDAKPERRKFTAVNSKWVSDMMEKLESKGLVEKAFDATYGSPAHPVNKAGYDPAKPIESQKRLAVDYRSINRHIRPTTAPLPNTDVWVDAVAGAKYFAVLDADNGFWQFEVDPETSRLLAITTDRFVYYPKRLPQGANVAAGPFHSAMMSALGDLVYRPRNGVLVYIDDVLVYAESLEEFQRLWREVHRRLMSFGFRMSAKKVKMIAKRIKFCGRIYSAAGIEFDPEYVRSVVNMAQPVNAAELRQYLAMCNWLRLSIPRYNELAAPLQVLLKCALKEAGSATNAALKRVKLRKFGWAQEHDTAFERLNAQIAMSTMLAYPDSEKQFCLFTDASDLHYAGVVTQVAVEELSKAVLEQQHEPLAFVSGSFVGSQLRWCTLEKEGFAIKESCAKLSHLLQRDKPFLLYTDHANLTYLFSNEPGVVGGRKQTADRIERWQVFMRAFLYEIRHISGEANIAPDLLTRWAVQTRESEHVDSDEPPELVHYVARVAALVSTADVIDPVIPDAGVACEFDRTDAPSLDDLIAASVGVLTAPSADLTLDGVTGLWKDRLGRVYVPDANYLRLRVLIVAHQGAAGHRGVDTTWRNVREFFQWESMERDVRKFVSTCLHCARSRGGHVIPRPLLRTIAATAPNELIHFDFMHVHSSPEQPVEALLVVRDDFSHFVMLFPCEKQDSDVTVHGLQQWFALFGVVKYWSSDQGSHFVNEVMAKLQRLLAAEHRFTAAYAPWSNGKMERSNKEVKELMQMLLAEQRMRYNQWPTIVPVVQAVMNQTPSKLLGGYSPLEVFTGHKPTSVMDVIVQSGGVFPVRKARLTMDEVVKKVEKVRESFASVTETVAAVYKRGKRELPGERPIDFGVGDYVLVSRDRHPASSEKVAPTWLGPARVVEHVSPYVYKVQYLTDNATIPVHAQFLKRFADSDLTVTPQLKEYAAHGGSAPVIASVLGHRLENAQWQLNVLMSGCAAGEAEWRLFSDVVIEAAPLVRTYVKTVKNAVEKRQLQALLQQ